MKNSNGKRNILVVGLNPALQRSIKLNSLIPGSVNRGVEATVGIGGKGQDVIVAASCLVEKRHVPSLLQFLGSGYEGDALANLIEQKTGIKVDSSDDFSIRTKGKCRTCITLLDMKTEEATEIIEPSEQIEANEIQSLMNKVTDAYINDKTEGLVIMGSMPPGCPDDVYSKIISMVSNESTKVILDTATGLNEIFNVCKKMNIKPILKVNARELCKLANVQVLSGSETAAATEGSILVDACKKLQDKYQTQFYAAITDGPFFGYLLKIDSSHIAGWKYSIPKLHKPFINPIGAGDATSSGLCMYICDKVDNSNETDFDKKIQKAFAWGLSCGSASCMQSGNSVFELNDCKIIFDGIKIEKYI